MRFSRKARLAGFAGLIAAGAVLLAAPRATAAQVSIPTPQDLGLALVWTDAGTACRVVSPCVSRSWTQRVALNNAQYGGVAGRLRKARHARGVVADLVAATQRWPGVSVVSANRRGVELWLITGTGPAGPILEVVALRGQRFVVLQLLGSPRMPPGASLGTLRRNAIRMAKPRGGSIPLGSVVAD